MADLERELRIAEAMAGDLKEYLLSDVLYWRLSDSGPKRLPFPLGTVGGMLLRLRRLGAAEGSLTPEQYERLGRARQKADGMLKQWVVQAEQKEVREVKARLQTWGAFVDDAMGDPKRHVLEYPTQVENRAIMEMLLERAGRAADGHNFRAHLDALDQRLRANTTRGDFVWDPIFASAFPAEQNWWLYVRLQK